MSVHGISYLNGQTLAVAVGDTFLFSSFAGMLDIRNCITTRSNASKLMSSTSAVAKPDRFLLAPLIADSYCITHCIPYLRYFVGPGIEDISAQRLLASSRSPHM